MQPADARVQWDTTSLQLIVCAMLAIIHAWYA